jgi:hypothetical protein
MSSSNNVAAKSLDEECTGQIPCLFEDGRTGWVDSVIFRDFYLPALLNTACKKQPIVSARIPLDDTRSVLLSADEYRAAYSLIIGNVCKYLDAPEEQINAWAQDMLTFSPGQTSQSWWDEQLARLPKASVEEIASLRLQLGFIPMADKMDLAPPTCPLVQRINLDWPDLILPEETKDTLRTYCHILLNRDWYVEQGVPMPKGILFHGPPGCGKTQAARCLSTTVGLPFISLSSADLKVGWIGQAAVAIQKYFTEAREKAPSIIYIDEIEASCPVRSAGANSVIDNEVNAQLLQEMDGIKTTDAHPVFVFASTNRLDMIDPAILERFTDRIEIKLPDAYARLRLLAFFIGKIPVQRAEPPPEAIERLIYESCRSLEEPTRECAHFVLTANGPHDDDIELEGANSRQEALSMAWDHIKNPQRSIVMRWLTQVTDGISGRGLKNIVTRAIMKAVGRSAKQGVRQPVVLLDTDFSFDDVV